MRAEALGRPALCVSRWHYNLGKTGGGSSFQNISISPASCSLFKSQTLNISSEAGYTFLSDSLQEGYLQLTTGIWTSLSSSSILLGQTNANFPQFSNCSLLHWMSPGETTPPSSLIMPFTFLFLDPVSPGGSPCLFGDDSESLPYSSTWHLSATCNLSQPRTFCIRNSQWQ